MAKSKSKQPEDQTKTHEQPENPAEPKVPTKASSSKPLAKGFVLDESPGQQIFIGGLPGKPPDSSIQQAKHATKLRGQSKRSPI